ncbi:putative quinol monooxygenase [Halobacillus litoralis]|uniref:putative quinol monooxygenase n=1 Tax=Halobacillus litoralis TaxID=45668 RepID=UPI001CD38FA1|nr:putative quinol monooxygenase [Halobacillus litoralis]MCA1023853.1 antibiotic biosynthesis monooxygenase [Halobacillus litoralis]
MYIVHAVFEVAPDQEQAFLNEIRPLIQSSREEEGNVSYDLVKDMEKEYTYKMVEVWQNAEAVEKHNQSEHFQTFVGKASDFLAAPLSIHIYEGEEVQQG